MYSNADPLFSSAQLYVCVPSISSAYYRPAYYRLIADLRKEELDLRDGEKTTNANFEDGSIDLSFSPDEERGVIKKIDYFVLPMVSNTKGPLCEPNAWTN